MSGQDNHQVKLISVDDLVREFNALESTYKPDDFDAGYQTAVADMFGIIARLVDPVTIEVKEVLS